MRTTFGRCTAGGEAAYDGIDVALLDGTSARLRPARADDRCAVRAFYQRLSPESRYFRFFGKPHVDDIVDDLVRSLELHSAFALLAEIDHHVVAIGQYFAIPGSPTRAEVAFAIADAYQGRGIGTLLLEHLARVAKTRGIVTFEAYLLSTNARMHEVFAHARCPVTWDHPDGSVTHAVLSL